MNESIKKFLLEEKGRTAFSNWVKEERERARITVNESLRPLLID